RFEQYVDVATVQVATAVLISAVTAPLLAAWLLKRNGALSNPEELEGTDAASVTGASSPSHLEAGAEAAEASAPTCACGTVPATSMAPDGPHAAGGRPAQGAPEGRRGPEATARGRRRREPEDSCGPASDILDAEPPGPRLGQRLGPRPRGRAAGH